MPRWLVPREPIRKVQRLKSLCVGVISISLGAAADYLLQSSLSSLLRNFSSITMSGPRPALRFPVYQIDFSAVASGKRVAATKRRIRWYVKTTVKTTRIVSYVKRSLVMACVQLVSCLHISRISHTKPNTIHHSLDTHSTGVLDSPIEMLSVLERLVRTVAVRNTTLLLFGRLPPVSARL